MQPSPKITLPVIFASWLKQEEGGALERAEPRVPPLEEPGLPELRPDSPLAEVLPSCLDVVLAAEALPSAAAEAAAV